MRFMIIIKANADGEAGKVPDPSMLEDMGKFNEELVDAGVLLAAEGLKPSSEGARVTFRNGRLDVKDGPFAETKELIAGFWIIQVKSKDDALAWIKKVPFDHGETVELRRVAEASDFEGVASDETIAKELAWRDANQKPLTN